MARLGHTFNITLPCPTIETTGCKDVFDATATLEEVPSLSHRREAVLNLIFVLSDVESKRLIEIYSRHIQSVHRGWIEKTE